MTTTIEQLKPWIRNPRSITKEAIEGLKTSLDAFGDLGGIVFNVRLHALVGGHQRTSILPADAVIEIDRRYDEPTRTGTVADGSILIDGERFKYREVDWSEEKHAAGNIAANNPKVAGEFTSDLGALLDELNMSIPELSKDLRFDDLSIEFRDLWKKEFVQDEAPEAPAIARTVPGDLYELGRHRILCGDSTIADDVGRLMDGKEALLMVTDPPYGVDYDPEWRARAGINKSKGRMGRVTNDTTIDWTAAWALCGAQVAYVWHGGKHTDEVADSLRRAEYDIIAQIIWVKDQYALSRGDYHWGHEPCWYVVKQGRNHNWQGARDQSTTWKINRIDKNEDSYGHPTQKPIECMFRPIVNNSRVGDLVVDPFLGTGTTLIAAEQSDRICYGLELEPKYCDVIVTRYCNFTGKSIVKLNGQELDWKATA